MNESQIEILLRHAPKVALPAGLLAQLQADIRLPRANIAAETLWFKRWIPALSFGLFVVGCLVALAIQTGELNTLRNENQTLLQSAAAEPPDRTAFVQTLESLRKDQQELANLRAESEQLRQMLAQIPELQSQNATLREQFRAQSAVALTNSDDPFAAAKAKADSVQCMSNMKQIGLAVRMWANDHRENYPPDLLTPRNELNTPKILVCPADSGNLPAEFLWERLDPSRVSYEYFGAGQNEISGPGWVLTRCRLHGHVGLCDGSVLSGKDRLRLVPQDGRLKVAPQNQ